MNCIESVRLDLLELFGRGYVVEHCISAFNEKQKEETYRLYVAEILRGIGKQVGVSFSMSYTELIKSMKPQKEETRTADEIIGGIKDKLRRLGGD